MNKKWKILSFCHLKNDKNFFFKLKNIKKNIKLLKSKKKNEKDYLYSSTSTMVIVGQRNLCLRQTVDRIILIIVF